MALGDHGADPGIRNLIREDKVHQIYSAMQTGQEKVGMQTMNQSLASLYLKRLISLETAMSASSNRDELQDMINRGVGVVPGAGAAGTRPGRPPGQGGRSRTEVRETDADVCIFRSHPRRRDD